MPPIKADFLVIIVNWNTKALLSRCLTSLRACKKAIDFDTAVIDNGSQDGSATMVANEFPECRLLRNEQNLGFAKANNFAFNSFPGYEHYLLLNSDASVTLEAMEALLSLLRMYPDIAAAGPALKLPNGRYQFGGAGWGPSWLYAFNTFFLLSNASRLFRGLFICQENYAKSQQPVMVDWLAGACLLIRAAALKDVGILDERYFVYGEDADWCWRARKKGWKIAYLPYVCVLHEMGASSAFKLNTSWFLNLASAVKARGSKMNYVLFLICGLIGYFIRLTLYAIQCLIKNDKGSLKCGRQCASLFNICCKLVVSSVSSIQQEPR